MAGTTRPSRFHLEKIAALLHDPAWKPWIVSSAFPAGRGAGRVGRVLARVPGETEPAALRIPGCERFAREYAAEDVDAHQLDAAALAYNVLSRVSSEAAKVVEQNIREGRLVAEADLLAASIDRWIFTYVRKDVRDVKVDVRKALYANPLDPRFRAEINYNVDVQHVCKYASELAEKLEELQDAPWPLIYNTLYLLLEPLWYRGCSGCIPLADTRTPTHTVFDHVYATASMVNWLYPGDRIGGFLVKIDVAGIQAFIGAARKTRDLWAGSWLVSALAWYTVSEAVMLLGGDIVLSPYTPANPFFTATLLKELEKRSEQLRDKLDQLVEEAYLWKGAASQPVVPGTFILALPCIDDDTHRELMEEARKLELVDTESARRLLEALSRCDDEMLTQYFHERFVEGWKRLWEAAFEATGKSESVRIDEMLVYLADILKDYSDFEAEGVKRYLRAAYENPPLQLRVVVVDVAKAYEELKRYVREYVEKHRSTVEKALGQVSDKVVEELVRKLLFSWLLTVSLPEEETKLYYRSVSVEAGFRIGDVLEQVTGKFKRKREYHECSVCSKLPAIIHLEDDSAARELASKLGLPLTAFSGGESLCPYCLLKRLISFEKALIIVMDKLGLYVSTARKGVEPLRRAPPSTDELAVLNGLLALGEVLYDDEELLRRVESLSYKHTGKRVNYAPRILIDYLRGYGHEKGGEDVEKRVERVINGINTLYEQVSQCGDELPHMMASGVLDSNSIGKCLDALKECKEEDDKAKKLCEVLIEIGKRIRAKEAGPVGGRYYAIVRGDGDFFGKRIVRGILDFNDAQEYLERVLEAISDEAVRVRLYNSLRGLVDLLIDVIYSAWRRGDRPVEKPVVLVTPAYYTALSRGQMVTALYDADIVELVGGFPVYAGGDDVAVLAPSYISPERLKRLAKALIESSKAGSMFGNVLLNYAERSGFVAGLIALLTRRNYWGLLSPLHGFHKTPVGAYYPAPVAYGRSYGVYIVHYRDPFMAAWSTAGELEELKDKIVFAELKDEGSVAVREKDVVFLSYGRVPSLTGAEAPAVALPNLRPSKGKENVVTDAKLVGEALNATLQLASMVEAAGRRAKLSRSLYSDFEAECSVAKEIALRMIEHKDFKATELGMALASMLVKRNAREERYADEAISLLKGWSRVVPVPKELKDHVLGRARAGPEKAQKTVEEAPLLCLSPAQWQIVLGAYVLSSGRR